MAWLPLFIESTTRRCERCGIRLYGDEDSVCEFCQKEEEKRARA